LFCHKQKNTNKHQSTVAVIVFVLSILQYQKPKIAIFIVSFLFECKN